MAATLPPINKNRNNAMPSYGKPRMPPGGRLDPLSPSPSKGGRDKMGAEKNVSLKAQMPILRKKDIAK